MQNYKTTVIALSVHAENENPTYGESVTVLHLEDEGGGPFLSLTQAHGDGERVLRFDLDEFRAVAAAVEVLMAGDEAVACARRALSSTPCPLPHHRATGAGFQG